MAQWIPLMDYAVKYGVSLSTLRRYIKANKIPYKIENGRYLLREDGASHDWAASATASAVAQANPNRGDSVALVKSSQSSAQRSSEIEQLKAELRKAREEIAELKMLVALYEDQTHHAPSAAYHPPVRDL